MHSLFPIVDYPYVHQLCGLPHCDQRVLILSHHNAHHILQSQDPLLLQTVNLQLLL